MPGSTRPCGRGQASPARGRLAGIAALSFAAVLLAACSSQPRTVQVVDRTSGARGGAPLAAPVSGQVEAPRPITEESYTVKRGDTLYQISLDHGQDWRDIARWNNLNDPNQLRVGQVLRVAQPRGQAASAPPARLPDNGVAQTAPVTGPVATGPRPLDTPAASPATPAPASAPAETPPPPPAPARPATPVKPDAPGEQVDWAWPTSGKVIENFSDSRNKGLDIAGTPGDPILAAADGKVVYSGNGLRGYGNLIIIKHNATYLSAYAHNRAMLVKEGQSVRRGQKIAELGSTDAESPRLHFEIRRLGKPIDPASQLPQR